MTAPALMTADELERLPETGKRTELVRGHLVVREPPEFRHGDIVANLTFIFNSFVRPRNLGRVLAEPLNGEDVLPGFTCVLSEVL